MSLSGFYDRSTEGIWRWVDCLAPNSFGNLNWENPEGPDSTDGDEDCAVILDSSGRYEAITCETPRSYICEIGAPSKLRLPISLLYLAPNSALTINGCIRLASLGRPHSARSGEPLTRANRTITLALSW